MNTNLFTFEGVRFNMKYFAILCLATFVAGVVAEPFGECPEVDGDTPKYLPDLIDRDVFWECSNGKPIKLVCPTGLIHDPFKNVCVFPSMESELFGPIGKCEKFSSALLRDGLNVSAFWACKLGEPVLAKCTNNMWFTAEYGGACYVPE